MIEFDLLSLSMGGCFESLTGSYFLELFDAAESVDCFRDFGVGDT